ncbi:DUF6446 family protein [Oceaniglobus roseus]|uniref:DUF6446 family protein n=1 Tax=Oceaniglobus roseus TaxID=1737570 RepID=UPI000C7F1B7A|nr:DUF6446 family protein [Kandeliimicrobium roseum]
MKGKHVVIAMLAPIALAGAVMYYLQVYGYYEEVTLDPATGIELTVGVTGEPEPILAEGIEAIDADSSPLRFRACFHTPMSQAMLTETYEVYEDPVPLTAPGWFSCFDAGKIEAALETGEAIAFLGQRNIHYGVDRVIAVFGDGRAYAWHQLNNCGETRYDGTPTGPACPPRED